jgi:hypothetical protein
VQDAEDDLDSDTSDVDEEPATGRAAATTGGDEFNFGNYDQEEDARLRLGDIAIVDPTENTEDLPDSEDEDDTILKTDNLILVGRVEDNAATLEVYGERHVMLANLLEPYQFDVISSFQRNRAEFVCPPRDPTGQSTIVH